MELIGCNEIFYPCILVIAFTAEVRGRVFCGIDVPLFVLLKIFVGYERPYVALHANKNFVFFAHVRTVCFFLSLSGNLLFAVPTPVNFVLDNSMNYQPFDSRESPSTALIIVAYMLITFFRMSNLRMELKFFL